MPGNTLSVFGTANSSVNGVFHGILFAVTLFIGFDAAASIGEEAHDPHRSIPIALVGSVALAGLSYLPVTCQAPERGRGCPPEPTSSMESPLDETLDYTPAPGGTIPG
jgi:hypothetical protein